MKTILRGAVAAIALVSMGGVAQADQVHYSSPLGSATNPSSFVGFLAEVGILAGIGTRYTAKADAPGDLALATPTVNVAFKLTGTVNKDCSFYAGNNSDATNTDFGVIGVRTGNNENVNSAFEMVGQAEADIETLTAGCNFNNTVSITKSNGAQGLVNAAPGGYDSDEFQANIPYKVQARWQGTSSQSGPAASSGQVLDVDVNAASDQLLQGAWRSAMKIDIIAPRATKALVAGNYADTMTLTLTAS